MKGNKHSQKKQIPDIFQDIAKWETDRRTFLRGALIAGAMTQIAAFTSCSSAELIEGNDLLSAEEATILNDVLNVLFPDDGNGPGAEGINAFGYIMWVLHDTLNRKPEENEYITGGLKWTNEMADAFFETPFVELTSIEKKALVGKITEMEWGRPWCSVIITLILEALLLDPIYGGNTNEEGWKWLNHTAGFPRPTEENRYERIMERQMKL